MQLHNNLLSALQHPSTWAGLSGVMSSMGAQLDRPFSIMCYGLAAIFSVIAIIVKTPQDNTDAK